MRLRAFAGACCAALSLCGLAAAPAAADAVNVGGGPIPSGTTVGAMNSGPITFSGSAITCASSTLSGPLGTNPAPPGPSDDVQWSISAWSFGSCTDTIPLITVTSITMVGLPYTTARFDADIGPRVVVPTPLFLVNLSAGSCTYVPATAPLVGGFSNATSTLQFNQNLARTSGTTACPTTLVLAGTYGPFRIPTTAAPITVVN